jgi:hypothetical protein
MKKLTIILFLFIFVVSFVNGLIEEENEIYTGNYFYRVLKTDSNEPAFSKGLVMGYITGLWQSLDGIFWEYLTE